MHEDEFEPEDVPTDDYEGAEPTERTSEDYELEIRTLRNRLTEAQEDFDQCQARCDELEEQSNKLLSAFIAASELQQVSGMERLKQVISDIILNIVGASQFVLCVTGEEDRYSVIVSREIDLDQLDLDLTSEPFLGPLKEGRAWLSSSVESADELKMVLPIIANHESVGFLVVFRYLPERPEVDLAQEKIFDMLSKNVAASLILSTLFEGATVDVSSRSDIFKLLTSE